MSVRQPSSAFWSDAGYRKRHARALKNPRYEVLNARLNASETMLRGRIGDQKVDNLIDRFMVAGKADPRLFTALYKKRDPYRWLAQDLGAKATREGDPLMPATATGRGAQVIVDPLGNTAKAMRGAYAATFEANAAKVAADVLAGLAADGNRPDGTTSTGSAAADVDVNPATTANIGTIIVGTAAGPTITSGTGIPAITQPSGSIFIRTDGAAGARIYVNQNGAATWLAIATV